MNFALQVCKRFYPLCHGLLAKEAVRAGLLYAVALAFLFAPVVFLGRSLQAPLYYPDALVESGLIEDDNVNFITGNSEYYGGIDRSNPRVEAEIIEISA